MCVALSLVEKILEKSDVFITLLRSITVFCRTDNVLLSIYFSRSA